MLDVCAGLIALGRVDPQRTRSRCTPASSGRSWAWAHGLVARVARPVKRRWEDPVTCGGRLAPMLDEPDRWAPAGEAAWRFEAEPKPWPEKVTAPGTVAAVRAAIAAVTA